MGAHAVYGSFINRPRYSWHVHARGLNVGALETPAWGESPILRSAHAACVTYKGSENMLRLRSKLTLAGVVSVALVTALFASAASSGAASSPNISVKSFTKTFAAMKLLRPLAAKGKGSIEVILPDTVTSTRYTEFDAPYLTKAFKTAGLSSSQFKV